MEENVKSKVIGLPKAIVITKLTNEEPQYPEVVENGRKELLKAQKTGKFRSNIAMIVIVILLALSIGFIQSVPVVAYICLGSSILTLVVFMILNKRVARPDVKGYVLTASTAINRYIYNDDYFSDVTYNPTDKIDLADVFADGVYEGIVNLASRNITIGKYNGKGFTSAELALYAGGKNSHQRQDLFVGKYLCMSNSLHFEDRYVINLRGEKDIDLPNGVDDLKTLFSDKYFSIFGKENADYQRDLSSEFINAIKRIRVRGHLLNLNIVVWAGRSIVYASYDDATIVLPFYEPINKDSIESYKMDLLEYFRALEVIA